MFTSEERSNLKWWDLNFKVNCFFSLSTPFYSVMYYKFVTQRKLRPPAVAKKVAIAYPLFSLAVLYWSMQRLSKEHDKLQQKYINHLNDYELQNFKSLY